MSVYVDNLQNWGQSRTWRLGASCHMIADTLDELHEMADSIGMKRAWFQAKASTPHYDLTASRRDKAVKLGATVLDRAAFVAKLQEIRAASRPLDPSPPPQPIFT